MDSAEAEIRLHLWRILRPLIVVRQWNKSSCYLQVYAEPSYSLALCKRPVGRHRQTRLGNGWTRARACATHRSPAEWDCATRRALEKLPARRLRERPHSNLRRRPALRVGSSAPAHELRARISPLLLPLPRSDTPPGPCQPTARGSHFLPRTKRRGAQITDPPQFACARPPPAREYLFAAAPRSQKIRWQVHEDYRGSPRPRRPAPPAAPTAPARAHRERLWLSVSLPEPPSRQSVRLRRQVCSANCSR